MNIVIIFHFPNTMISYTIHLRWFYITQVFGRVLNKRSLKELAEINDGVPKLIGPTGPGVELDLFLWLRFINPSSRESYKKVLQMADDLDQFFIRKINHNKVISINSVKYC